MQPDGAHQHTQSPIVTGTSVVAIKYSEGVVIAADNLGKSFPPFPHPHSPPLHLGTDLTSFSFLRLPRPLHKCQAPRPLQRHLRRRLRRRRLRPTVPDPAPHRSRHRRVLLQPLDEPPLRPEPPPLPFQAPLRPPQQVQPPLEPAPRRRHGRRRRPFPRLR